MNRLIITAGLLLMTMGMKGQTFQQLWDEVQEAVAKDLPRTAMTALEKLETKATEEQEGGQLVKATLMHSKLLAEIAPDSLRPAVDRIERQLVKTATKREQSQVNLSSAEREQARTKFNENQNQNAVLAAVLSLVYRDNPMLDDNWMDKSREYAERALQNPEALAAVKDEAFSPFVVLGRDSEVYGHDLLSVIGSELGAWELLYDYYAKAGNRQAACLTACHLPSSIAGIDSLIAIYSDLPEACELAVRRYDSMDGFAPKERLAWLDESLQRWGAWKRSGLLKNRRAALLSSQYYCRMDYSVAEVNKAQTVRLTGLRNLQSLTIRVFRTTLAGDTELNPDEKGDYERMSEGLTEVKEAERTVTFSGHEPYDIFEDSLLLQGLPAGVYMIETATQPQTEVHRQLYFVSALRLLRQAQPDQKTRYVVVDATTGQPVAGAKIRLSMERRWDEEPVMKTLTCNARGEAVYNQNQNENEKQNVQGSRVPVEAFAYTKSDCYCPPAGGRSSYYYSGRTYQAVQTKLFTDRSIYRPGQTVYVTALVWQEKGAMDNVVLEDYRVNLELRDANYKTVGTQTVQTDRYGKCSAQFTLPMGLLGGRFTVRSGGSSVSIRVEEYKRPTFQVEFEEYKEAYQQGDTVKAKAQAMTYSGVPVQDAKVKYAVYRQMAWWWLSYSSYWNSSLLGWDRQRTLLYEAETTTDEEGMFTADMPMLLPGESKSSTAFYHFVVEADVTDMAGETHHGTMSLPLGNRRTALVCDLPRQVRSDQLPQVTFSRRNAAGQEIEGMVKYRLDGGKWQQTVANVQCSLFNVQCKSGEHRLEAVCEDDSIELTFVVFGLDDTMPAFKTDDWFYLSSNDFPADGKPVTLQVGSSDPDLYIVYSIFSGEKMLENGVVKENRSLLNRKFTYKEEYGNGLLLTYAWVKNGICHNHQAVIRRPMPDKKLKLKWETFRDRLTPGQQEEWTITVNENENQNASLLAVLYDKSLDALVPHTWSLSPEKQLPLPVTNWLWQKWGGMRLSGVPSPAHTYVPYLSYSHFDSSVFPKYAYPRMLEAVPMPVMKTARSRSAVAEDNLDENDSEIQNQNGSQNDGENSQQSEATEEVQVRENLNETAFCYPNVETDSEGRFTLKFTLPESLTTWRFMGIANTADMLYGYIEGEAVAKKDVMIQPNVPRFVRAEDEAHVSARIFNTSERTVNGQAKLQLIDPETENVVYEQSQAFTVEAGKTGVATFDVQCSTFNVSLLICKVMAVGDGFSDGEQHYLPLLPNREYVTKTVSYTQHEPGVKTIDVAKLFPQGTTQRKMTVEYTNNPAWLMVQSLPLLGHPWEHSAIDQAAAYYSNLLAKTLLDKSPQVKNVFSQWLQETTQEQSLQSQLQKNQELKDLILAETPWVAAADREAEQKRQLALFFNENDISYRLDKTVKKLEKLQNTDGSFSWYEEMPGSISITVAVEEMLARLNTMVGEQSATRKIQEKAFNYIGREMVETVRKMKEREQQEKKYKPSFPSFTALRWLYICAIDGRKLSQDFMEANDYLINLLKKDIKRQTLYEKALTAIVLSKHGETETAAEYVKSLIEYSVYTEEMGRYYDTRKASYSWYDYKIPTEVAALEAIQTVAPEDKKTVAEMRRWLLQEKRTQAWGTPINSVNAIYGFLNDNSKQLTASSPNTVLAIDGQSLELPQATAGFGYVKTAISEPKGKVFTATKTSQGTSWGAVYAQFFQKTSEIEASNSGISVKRELLLNNNGQWSPVNGQCKVGDRVKVRITIQSSRDLDFVQVVDHRAACMEPVNQLSGYRNGVYCMPKDNATNYYYWGIAKGKHVLETEYYIDREGQYEMGTCTVGCAYAPEYRATSPSMTLKINK